MALHTRTQPGDVINIQGDVWCGGKEVSMYGTVVVTRSQFHVARWFGWLACGGIIGIPENLTAIMRTKQMRAMIIELHRGRSEQ